MPSITTTEPWRRDRDRGHRRASSRPRTRPTGSGPIVVDGIDATSEVPPDRWLIDPAEALDPRIALPDHVYTTRGGFVGPVRGSTRPGPASIPACSNDSTRSSTWPSPRRARPGATRGPSAVDRGRTGVVFGNIVLPTETASALSLELLGRRVRGAARHPGAGSPIRSSHCNAFPAGLPGGDRRAGPSGLGGVAYTLDAACGSSLYALKLAVDELRSGRADAMITRRRLATRCALHPDGFLAAPGALASRARRRRSTTAPTASSSAKGPGCSSSSGWPTPSRQGDQIYGIIAGIGLSNDVHGDLLAPDSEGQLRAMRAAYEQAGWSPDDVDLIECHATGTPRGDAVEVAEPQDALGRHRLASRPVRRSARSRRTSAMR